MNTIKIGHEIEEKINAEYPEFNRLVKEFIKEAKIIDGNVRERLPQTGLWM